MVPTTGEFDAIDPRYGTYRQAFKASPTLAVSLGEAVQVKKRSGAVATKEFQKGGIGKTG